MSERKAFLLEQLEEAKRDLEFAKSYLADVQRKAAELKAELDGLYCHQYSNNDIPRMRRDILGVMGTAPGKLWSLGEIADRLPQYQYEDLSRQLRALADRNALLWTGKRGAASKYGKRA